MPTRKMGVCFDPGAESMEQAERSKNIIYFSNAQQLVYNFGARHTKLVCGRAFGKTTGGLAAYIIRMVQSMPRGNGIFLGNSIKQLYSKTVPNVVTAMQEMVGWREGVHFFRGHAPAKMEFKEPIVKPKEWSNVIHFKNGFTLYLISTAVRAAANGMNLCAVLADEARFLPENIINGEIMPALRGIVTNHPGFDEQANPFFKSTFFVSDAPLSRRQDWMAKYKEQQTFEVNREIAEMLADAAKYPRLAENEKFLKRLTELRCEANVFFSFSSFENYAILGEQYFRQMQRTLTPAQWNVSILNKGREKINEGYYTNLNIDEVHGYTPSDESQTEAAVARYGQRVRYVTHTDSRGVSVDSEAVNLEALVREGNCILDTDIRVGEPLRIALDYNGDINCLVCGQTPTKRDNGTLRVLKSFTNIKSTRLEGLMEQWCKYYEPHRASCNEVIFYYDSTAKQGGSYASENRDDTRFYMIVCRALRKHHWNVTEVSMGTPMSHNKKYELINACLAGVQRPAILINKDNNENLIASMENAALVERNGAMMKDKSREKYRVSQDSPDPEAELAQRTDLSDAFDTLVIGTKLYGSGMNTFVSMPSVF